jgi:hypothetical protein
MAEKRAKPRAEGSQAGASEKVETLNFKIPINFKKAFEGYAVAQGMSMVELLREGFELSKARRRR